MNEAIQKAKEFITKVREIRKSLIINIDEKTSEELGMEITELRRRKRMANEMINADACIRANEMKKSGYTNSEIAKLLNESEGYIRYVLGKDEDVARAIIEIYAKKLGYVS